MEPRVAANGIPMKRLVLFSSWLLPALATAACSKELAVAQNAADGSPQIFVDAGSLPFAPSPETPDADMRSAPGIVAGGATTDAPSNCNGVGAAQQVVTLVDIGGQWVSGCDPLPFLLTALEPSDAGMDLPVDTAGFEIDPTSHLFYALVPSGGSYARASGAGSVWWASDVYPYGVLPDGGPQEYLLVTNANLFDGGRYTQKLQGWGILYCPARDGGVRSLTLLSADAASEVTLLPPEVVLAKSAAH
jgi:hypothetical protein